MSSDFSVAARHDCGAARGASLHRPHVWALAVLLVATLGLLASVHVGFQASDDAEYLTGAVGWIKDFPYVGDNHWTLRHTITIPTALAVSLFGLNELSVSLTNIVYFVGFLVVNGWFAARYLGTASALFATALMITLPGFVVVATYLNTDIAELFYVCCAFWVLRLSMERPGHVLSWLLVGVALGLAFVTRETAAAAVVFVGLVYIFHPAAPRSRYVVIAAGFLTILALDWLYLLTMTGDAFYRFAIDLHHDRVDRYAEALRVASTGGLLDKEGNISISVWLDPIVNLFASQKFTLLFWLTVPAAVHLWRHRARSDHLTLGMLSALALVTFVFVAVNPGLYLVPRYLVIVAWACAVLVGCWFAFLWQQRRVVAALLFAAALGANAVALSVENLNPRFVERQLVQWVAAHPGETVYTDAETAERADFYFQFAGVSPIQVSTDTPKPGAVFYYNAERVNQCASLPRCKDRVVDFRPAKGWHTQQIIERPAPLLGRMAQSLQMTDYLPQDITRRLLRRDSNVTIYRVANG